MCEWGNSDCAVFLKLDDSFFRLRHVVIMGEKCDSLYFESGCNTQHKDSKLSIFRAWNDGSRLEK